MVLLFSISGTLLNGQSESFNISVQNIIQTATNKLEFDVYLLNTDQSQNFELANCQLGFLMNSLVYTGGSLSAKIDNTGSGLLDYQQFTVKPVVESKLSGYPDKTLVRLASTPNISKPGTIISTVVPGTLLTHFILTSSVDFKVNSTADLIFISSAASSPLYPTRVAVYLYFGSYKYKRQLTVTPGTNALVNGNPVLNPMDLPEIFEVTGTGSYCQGDDGLPVGLNGSETGVKYTLYKNGTPQEPSVEGTGREISFGNRLKGTYTVTGANKAGISEMKGSAIITENPAPAAPVPGTITHPTCELSTGSVIINGLPEEGPWTLLRDPGNVSTQGTGPGITVSGLAPGTYSFKVINSSGCTSGPSVNVTINDPPPLPAIPEVSVNCSAGFGKAVVTVTSPVGDGLEYRLDNGIFQTITTFTGVANGDHTVTVKNAFGCTITGPFFAVSCGCANPPAITLSSITGSTCGIGIVTVTGNKFSGSATSVTITENGSGTVIPVSTNTTPFDFAYVPAASDIGKTVIIKITTNNPDGPPCEAASAEYTLTVSPVPTPPVPGAITQPTCSVPTGSIILSGLPASGNWELIRNPGNVIISGTGISTTIDGLPPGTYTFKVKNSSGCISESSSGVTINEQPQTPAAPVVGTITQPTCILTTGSVLLSGLPSSGIWTITRYPGAIKMNGSGTSSTISGLQPGTYYFTVTGASGCTSGSSGNIVINDSPPVPAVPSVSVDCSAGAGKAVVTVTSPVGGGLEYRLDNGVFHTAVTFTGVANGDHTVTVKNTSGCTITGPSFAVSCGCTNPPVITPGSTAGSTCGTGIVTVAGNKFSGSATNVTITENGSGTVIPVSTNTTPFDFVYMPSESDIGKTVLITITTNNPEGAPCEAASAVYTLTVSPVPTPPVPGAITHPTCAAPTGSVFLSGLPATGIWELMRNPGNVIITGTGTSTTIAGLNPGTYTFQIKNSSGCVSVSSSNVIIKAQPQTPAAPVAGTITQPACAIPSGSVMLNGLPQSGSWTVTVSPGGITKRGEGTSTTITGLAANTYTFTVTDANGCNSQPSSNVIIQSQPVTPSPPVAGTLTPPSCTVATGSILLTGLPSQGSWTVTRYPGGIKLNGSGTSTTISGLQPGTYYFTVTASSGCTSSQSGSVIIPVQPPTPSAPVISQITQPTHTVATGSVLITGLPSSYDWRLTRSPGGNVITGSGSSVTVTGLEPGTYTFTVTNPENCTSPPSASVIIKEQPGLLNFVITDPPTICSTSTVDLTASAITAGSDTKLTYSYWIDKDATMPLHNPVAVAEGTYYIKGTLTIDENTDYFAIKPVNVTADQMPVADAGPDQFLIYTFETTMDALQSEYGKGEWSVLSGSGNFSDTDDPKTVVANLSFGRNDFLWTVTNGVCPKATDEVIIVVEDLVVPSLITPDMDGKNDYFILRGINSLGKTELVIFDRRGAKVYWHNNYDNTWNGIDHKGNPLPDDTYFYVIRTESGRSLSGFVVIRK